MREIKFRAWDKKRKEWFGASHPDILTFYGFHIFGECTLICTPPSGELMNIEITQYTGLQDKHGKDIYEGDIVTCYPNDIDFCYNKVVKWADDRPSLGITTDSSGLILCSSSVKNIEIIGNIYENPELMEGE